MLISFKSTVAILSAIVREACFQLESVFVKNRSQEQANQQPVNGSPTVFNGI